MSLCEVVRLLPLRVVKCSMRVAVLGANGLLGSTVVSAALDRGWTVHGAYHSTRPDLACPLTPLDIRDVEAVDALLSGFEPDAVVNCAAMTDVDGCEAAPEAAMAVNAEAPGRIAALCGDRDARFVHVSTDYVFDGRAGTPYAEADDPNPLQVYGESKLAGERAVADAGSESLTARLSFVYGVHRGTGALTGFPAWVRGRLRAGTSTPLFTDQRVSPSRAGATAATLLDLGDADATGLFHVAARSCVTPFEFGDAVRARMDADAGLLTPASLDAVDREAARPAYTCLDTSRVESVLERPQPTLDADLDALADAFD